MPEPKGQLLEKQSAQEQNEQAEQLRPEQLYGVLKAFDHIREYSDEQIEEMREKIHADLIQNRFPTINPEHLKRNEKELKDARHEYKSQIEQGKEPLPVFEELTAEDLIQFVYQNGKGNKGVDLQEVVNDKFNRLKLNVAEGEEEQFQEAKALVTPELVLLAKLQLEQDEREQTTSETILPPDAKLNRDAVDNIDAVGLAFQLKSMPNVQEPKDMLNWGYTSREAIFLYEWSKKAQRLLDPEGTGQISFGTEEEMEAIADEMNNQTEKIYPSSTSIKVQEQAMLRRMMKYMKQRDVMLHNKGPESIGLNYKESPQEQDDRLNNLIQLNLYEDSDLEPEETRRQTRIFREVDIPQIVDGLLTIQRTEGEEEMQASAKIIDLLGEHYHLFNEMQKDEFRLPELYDRSVRQGQSEKASQKMLEFLRVSTGKDYTESSFGNNVQKYIRILVELDHNASLKRSILQSGMSLSNDLFAELEQQEKDLAKEYERQLQELDEAIGASTIRPSERLRKIELAEPSTQNRLAETRRLLSGQQEVVSPELQQAQRRAEEVDKQRERLLFIKRILREKLGIKPESKNP